MNQEKKCVFLHIISIMFILSYIFLKINPLIFHCFDGVTL